jgi:uncharacterized protein YecE (DUF72 family)
MKLHIGTSGWSYRHWSGIFYPPQIKPDKYLEYYITMFSCVELNASFYHLPKEMTVTGWVKRTPETFKFCPKLSRFITHQRKLQHVEDSLQRYFEVFEEMKSRMGPVLIQLPPGMKFDRQLTADFLEVLIKQYDSYRFAFEVRHKSWITDEFMAMLADHAMAFVIADSGRRYPYYEAVTADFVYLRFHGHEMLYASDYGDAALAQYAVKIVHWLDEGKEVWIFFNNDFHGYAVQNALRLKEIVNMSFK